MSSSNGILDVQEGSLYYQYQAGVGAVANARPPLLLLHAAVTDHTLWDAQVSYFSARGWNCLRYDRFGYGKSTPSEEYLRSDPRAPVDHLKHVELLQKTMFWPGSKVVIVGLSMGGGLALEYTVAHPECVAALAVVAGGVPGFDHPNTPAEDELFARGEELLSQGNIEAAAEMQVHIWGDGPLQETGRMAKPLADRLLAWNMDIVARQHAKSGGEVFETSTLRPSALELLESINVPTAVGYGVYDETNTTEAMKHIGRKIKGASVKEFKTAHMVNMEAENEFNEWLDAWLETHVHSVT